MSASTLCKEEGDPYIIIPGVIHNTDPTTFVELLNLIPVSSLGGIDRDVVSYDWMAIVTSIFVGEDEWDIGFGGSGNHTGLQLWWRLESESYNEDILVA